MLAILNVVPVFLLDRLASLHRVIKNSEEHPESRVVGNLAFLRIITSELAYSGCAGLQSDTIRSA
jgi:hypothetical protein